MNETLNLVFMGVMVAGILLCLLRLLRGPTAADRAVAADTACTVATALLVFMGFVFDRYVYLDVSLVYAVLTFIGALAIARFLERGI